MKRVLIKRPTRNKGTRSKADYLKRLLAQKGVNAVKIDIYSYVVGWGRSRQRSRGRYMDLFSPPASQKSPTAFSRGYLVIHSAPSALTRHVEWAVANLLGSSVQLNWKPQPLLAGTHRTSWEWRDRVGTGAELASSLRGWHYLRYEIREEASDVSVLYRFTPELGIHRAVIDAAGSVMVNENQISSALSQNEDALRDALALSIGSAWDLELEQFRRVELEGVSHSRAV